MNQRDKNYAVIAEPIDEIVFNRWFFSEECSSELMEMEKHEIIAKISDILGSDPANLALAELIFESVKYDVTRHVIHHEYSRGNSVRSQLLFWIDSKINPGKIKKLSTFIDKYLR
jgi:hypothetical protein